MRDKKRDKKLDDKLAEPEEVESRHIRTINLELLLGWSIIVAVLIVAYGIEVLKGDRSGLYLGIFAAVIILPLIGAFAVFLSKPDWKGLCYIVVPGYLVMYIFVMMTGSTPMVFSYILPMLSLLILYHHPNLILVTGAASIVINIISIILNHYGITGFNSQTAVAAKDIEIQLALLVLCFGGCYFASRLYNKITRQNYEYINALNDKTAQIKNMSLQTITTIANMLDAKDAYTEGHSERVAIYSAQLARALGLEEGEVESIRKIALMHDIGKIGVTDNVLNKPGRLDDDEFEHMKLHTVIGGEIVKDINTIPGIYAGVRNHHERYDGSGYPDGLKGEEIPYIARIIAVADSFDAMTSNRVYRKHLDRQTVMSELERGAGTQFDPVIARKMIELLNSGEIKNLSPDI